MKAAMFHGVGRPQTIEQVDLDGPRPNEVIVRTVATGVCHSDLHYVDGMLPLAVPAILGHEAAGIVEAAGAQVSYVRPGDHVVACGSAWCGQCTQCLTGHANRCVAKPFRGLDEPPRVTWRGERVHVNVSNMNSFAERMLLNERQLVRVRDDLPFDVASIMGCGVITGVGAVLNTARVEAGSTVAVFGLGGVGLSAVQAAVLCGARQVIAVDLVESKLETAKQLGATHAVHAASEDAVEAIRAISGGGVDYSFEAIGNPRVVLEAIEALGPGGVCTIVGVLSGDSVLDLKGQLLWPERTVQACTMGSNRFRAEIPMLVELYMQGRLNLDVLVSSHGALEDVDAMLDALHSGEVARQVIMFE